MNNIQLSDHFTYNKLLRFVLPSIGMMIFTSLYSIVDGLFVSNFVGTTAFAAINLTMPLVMGFGSLGFMIATGGSAIISKALGEGKAKLANQYFTLLIGGAVVLSIVLAIIGIAFAEPIMSALGAEGEMLRLCVIYTRINMISLPAFFLQSIFQMYLVVAEKPHLSFKLTVAAGVTNAVFDYVFIGLMGMGIEGAAIATAMGEFVGCLAPLFYFIRSKDSILRFTKTPVYWNVLLRTCTNGASELMSSISTSVVTMLFNFQLAALAGENGIAAYGAIMYVNFIFAGIFLGFSIGSAPIISYHYGAGTNSELKNIFIKSLRLLFFTGIILTGLSELLAVPLINIFVGYDPVLFAMTSHGFKVYALCFLFSGFNIWGSSFFTALNNGLISAAISFLRTLIFQCGCVMILPRILGLDGIWISVIAAEVLALMVTGCFLWKNRNRYHYYEK